MKKDLTIDLEFRRIAISKDLVGEYRSILCPPEEVMDKVNMGLMPNTGGEK